ncbi:hypothetical protein DVU_3393 [Nitratidesulfovibrio vulgaris str. Hildenborough]|uniref:Uncharacterized protein n=1 Tax=Nitratidesulfovibrio vulgaris (strain ATCC 29579 / DSM 644 / CCUG 34227 / NCIMB 8303 / VKM B-1760 / Hildenborough) TaxID=882 RepID=Q725N1_NITV2|nr:hypothetical protein DVU_3393 [Nitratidesulfovibrio vulgaris str. Hildenborough]
MRDGALPCPVMHHEGMIMAAPRVITYSAGRMCVTGTRHARRDCERGLRGSSDVWLLHRAQVAFANMEGKGPAVS